MQSIKTKLLDRASQLGFEKLAFLPVRQLKLWDEEIVIRRQLDPDTAQYWDERRLTASFGSVMADARTFITASYPYSPYKYDASSVKGYFNAHYAAYPKGRKAMQELSDILSESGFAALVDPPLPIKQIAYLSGIGCFGRNGLIHSKESGSLMTLHLILTNALLPADVPDNLSLTDCGNCTRCIDSCPTGAITDCGRVILSKCLRYHMLSAGIIPGEIREKMGTRMLGCEDCQSCCPKNRSRYKEMVEPEEEIFDIMEILTNHSSLRYQMERIGRLVGKNYARAQRILSMAAIAAGNLKDQAYIEPLSRLINHPYPPVRAHSAWAIGKIGGADARAILEAALEKEQDPRVREELKSAIARLEL
ncbi:MAG TPA: HEAT repeat domain-containing protein [Candidatus Atribacteria bacterium]|nr:HEAT repeat domain-containing protein [Candidatus Atribacteria bacterium]